MAMAGNLHQQLARHLQADDALRSFILFDPRWDHRLDLARARQEGCTITAMTAPMVALHQRDLRQTDLDAAPLLIGWDPGATTTLLASLQAAWAEQQTPGDGGAEHVAVGGWLLSDRPAPRLACHFSQLQRALGAVRPALCGNDRELLAWVWPSLSVAQRAQWLGPIRTWWSLDRAGQLMAFHQPAPTAAATALQIDASLRRRLAWFPLAQILIAIWLQAVGEDADVLQHVASFMETLAPLALNHRQDLGLLAAYAAQVHPRLLSHPRVMALIDQAQAMKRPLVEVLASLADPQDWMAIRHDLNRRAVASERG